MSRFNTVHFNISVITFQYCSPLHLFQPTLHVRTYVVPRAACQCVFSVLA
jgi:hypothetical protein